MLISLVHLLADRFFMLTVALDTTTRGGSVALVDDDRVVDERSGDPSRTQAERLPAEIVTLLADHDRRTADVDLFVVASGPGSFTGLRVGIATMQGLALVGGRPIVGVSALDALAAIGGRDLTRGARVGAWMDAFRGDVFAALYEFCGDQRSGSGIAAGGAIEIEGPTVGDPAATMERWLQHGPVPIIIGDGAARYADAIARTAPATRVLGAPPLAAALARIGIDRFRQGQAGHPAAIQPLYVRRPDAELAREARRT